MIGTKQWQPLSEPLFARWMPTPVEFGLKHARETAGGTAAVLAPASAPAWVIAQVPGTVVLHIEVDTRGQAQNITVRQSLGLGLDERAIAAVRRWRFRPGYRQGKPWGTAAMVQVNFRLL